jgi:transcriptional regulator
MYKLPYFSSGNQADVLEFMRAHPFVTLCGVAENGFPVATHIPVLMVERENKLFLRAHIHRKSSHHKAFEHSPNVLAIFTGAHTYISASWYADPHVASTWNYQAVHASGILRFGDDSMLYDMLRDLTAHFEHNPHSPALVEEMTEEYVRKTMKAIIAFEIEITDLQHVFKLSQNRDIATRETVVKRLEERDDAESHLVAEEMKKTFTK